MSLSVALCTFNGSRYLAAQLRSIAEQSRPPDELVVCDDDSRDATADLVRDFAARAPFPVRLEVNSVNLGSTQNFARAISLCTGDLIALCDQDDVWLPDKLLRLEQTLTSAPDAGFAFSDACMADADLRPLGYSLWEAVRFTPAARRRFQAGRAFDCLLRRYAVTGATLAFRARLRDLVLPIPDGWVHDAWIALILSAVGRGVPLPEPLILYRQHAIQQIGEKKRTLYQQYLVARRMSADTHTASLAQFHHAYDRLAQMPGVSPAVLRAASEKVEHLRRKVQMRLPGAWRLPAVLREALTGRYFRYAHGWKSIAQDLFLA